MSVPSHFHFSAQAVKWLQEPWDSPQKNRRRKAPLPLARLLSGGKEVLAEGTEEAKAPKLEHAPHFPGSKCALLRIFLEASVHGAGAELDPEH